MSGNLDTWELGMSLGQWIVRSSPGISILCLVSLITLRFSRAASSHRKYQVLCATHVSIAVTMLFSASGINWFELPLVPLGTTIASGELQVLTSPVGWTADLQWVGDQQSGACRWLFVGLGWIWLVGFMALLVLLIRQLNSRMLLSRISFDQSATLQIRRRLRQSAWECTSALSKRVVVCRKLAGPTLVGRRGRMIGLPPESTKWDDSSLQTVVTHEHEHILNGDFFKSCSVVLVQCANWFNPLVWVWAHQSHLERETACDERSIAKLGTGPVEYFQSLLCVARSLSSTPQLEQPAMGGRSAIFRRAKRLTHDARQPQRNRSVFQALPLLALAVILVGAPLTDWGATPQKIRVDAVVEQDRDGNGEVGFPPRPEAFSAVIVKVDPSR